MPLQSCTSCLCLASMRLGLIEVMLPPLHAAHGCEWYALLGTKLSYAPSLELAVTESTLRRCSASTPSHALALINLLAHRARGVSEMDWRECGAVDARL